jgi:hypothetical protein
MLNSLGLPLYPGINVKGGEFLGLPVITSNSANIPGSPDSGRMIILVSPQEILFADDGQVAIDVSNEASIQMLDNPTNASTGGTTATTMVSMFQTALARDPRDPVRQLDEAPQHGRRCTSRRRPTLPDS